MKLRQNLDTIKGLRREQVKALGVFKNYELLTETDIESLFELQKNETLGAYVTTLLYDNELEIPEIDELIEIINLKRIFKYTLDDEEYFIVLPSKRTIEKGVLNHMNSLLLKVGRSYCEYKNCPLEEKKERLTMFENIRHKLILAIESEIFSKEFKNFYQMKFNGVTGVALTGNVSINGIYIPLWYATKNKIYVGDIGIVFRDPVQNLIIALRVEGFTANEMRVHSKVFTWLAGDHDGDKVQFIPLRQLINDNHEFISDINSLMNEVENIFPEALIKDSNPLKALLINADIDVSLKDMETPHTMLDMLHESKKSMKYAGAINEQEYLDNQASTVLNMRTVKEGTAFAGAFANWIFEKARLHNLDLIAARHLGDLIQQEALDSKHTVGGKGFMDSQWYKLTYLKNSCYRDNYNKILEKIDKILGDENYDPVTDDCNADLEF